MSLLPMDIGGNDILRRCMTHLKLSFTLALCSFKLLELAPCVTAPAAAPDC